jgi:hypothetical protein
MSQSEHSDLCKAMLEQGLQKGKQCDRPKLENGYCGKHQKQAELEKALSEGHHKCSRHRCTITFIPTTTKSIEYCTSCKEAKASANESVKMCKWEQLICKSKAKDSGYCGKHEPRALLLKDAVEKGVRICDDGKRACKNSTENNKLRCEECLEKERIKDNIKYKEKHEDLTKCLGCAKEITELLEGIRGDKVQRCADCYSKLRKTEDNRGVRERNYLAEKKANMEKYFTGYINSAKNINIRFDLTREQFNDLVLTPCFYCSSYNELEVIGIDRINSSKNYTLENCVPCCKTCNYMKGTLTRKAFILQAHKIAAEFPIEELSDSEEEQDDIIVQLSSNISPMKVGELYRHGKLNEYIEACIKDNRSPLFIEKLKGIQNNKMTYREFNYYFRMCCRAESKEISSNSNRPKQRISYREIYAYFNNKNSKYAIELYQSVHGTMGGFKEDMEKIAEKWDRLSFDERKSTIYTVMVKYQNQRAHGTVKTNM